jgi:hypothetical protein
MEVDVSLNFGDRVYVTELRKYGILRKVMGRYENHRLRIVLQVLMFDEDRGEWLEWVALDKVEFDMLPTRLRQQ